MRCAPIESWTPPPDAWPLGRYGPARTAANLDASPTPEPSVAWTADPLEVGGSLVVGPETVYVAGSGIAALARATGTVRWQADVPGGPLAVHDGTVFAAPVVPT